MHAVPHPSELKKALLARGFEVYRTTADEVVLADRVRDNLLMDSAVAARTGATLSVRVVVRAAAGDFPGESPDQLLGRARRLAEAAAPRGYTEIATRTLPIHDPGDRTRTLDTWYEVWLLRGVADAEELFSELTHALTLPKVADATP